MNWSIVEQVFLKDLQELSKNRYVFYSMLLLPVLLVSITIINIYSAVSSPPVSLVEISFLISTFSEIIILIPAIVSVLIGSTSVVIEKNNKSLEPLLATPITDTELLMGKALAPFIPAIILGFVAYGAVISSVDFLTYPVFGTYLLPTTMMLYQMFVMAPLVGLFGTFVALFISTKIKDVRAAQQVSTLAIMPLFFVLVLGSLTLASTSDLLLVLTVILVGAVIGFARLTIRQFNRESILISWK
ncbi:MAG TPA: ABC transporter permease subunit [Nitrososphaerales archaeon]|nr:ABC transporter permease subunit [Nitrososphaerales archaeon]